MMPANATALNAPAAAARRATLHRDRLPAARTTAQDTAMAVLPVEDFGSLVDTQGAARSDAFACRYVPAGGGHDVCGTRQAGALAVLENGWCAAWRPTTCASRA